MHRYRRILMFVMMFLPCMTSSAATSSTDPFYLPGVTLYRDAPVLDPFVMQSHSGVSFTLDNLVGRWNVLYFGYLSCPDACPTTMFAMKSVFADLWEEQRAADERPWQFLFVSLDPRRDTPDQVAEYIDFFDARFIGVTDGQEYIPRLTHLLDVEYEYETVDDGKVFQDYRLLEGRGNYFVNHTSALVVVDPAGRLLAHIHATRDPATVVELLRKLRGHFDTQFNN